MTKIQKMKLASLFNMVRTKRSIENEVFIHENKIDINIKNEKLQTSLLTSINIGMSNSDTYYTSKENALFIINNVSNPFFTNGRNTVDLLETFILNHFSYSKNDKNFLHELIIKKIFQQYKDRHDDFQKDILNTLKNMINNDDSKTNTSDINPNIVIQKSISNYILKNAKLKKDLKNLIKYEEENISECIPYTEALSENDFMILNTSKELFDIIFFYAGRYENSKLLEVCLNVIGWDNIENNFSVYLFKPLIMIATFPFNNSKEKQEHIAYIFENLNPARFPLLIDLDEELNFYIEELAKKNGEIFSIVNKYIIESNYYIKKSLKVSKAEENNNLKRTRI